MPPICVIAEKSLKVLESILNSEVVIIHTWLSDNKLTFNIDKSSLVFFHPPHSFFVNGALFCTMTKVLYHQRLLCHQIIFYRHLALWV